MPNALAAEKSPYLLQHADNPVAWLPWGEAAFAKARAEQKPIFLSIGYSTCHWCHVMAHESFESAALAAVLNRDFVPVKIDREERPDVDRIYMTYVQALSGHGGWPLSVWLTPELKPFYGGTYFPPEDRQGRPGFATVLRSIAHAWEHQRDRLTAEAARVIEVLKEHYAGGRAGADEASAGARAPAADVEQALETDAPAAIEQLHAMLNEQFDPQWAGFGGAPKFPRAGNLEFLLRTAAPRASDETERQEAVRMAAHTLRQMALGGIHDHVGGGFHRYAVDEEWHVPHFEKMLYDQAQIAVNYLDASQVTGDLRFLARAQDILDYVRRDLTHPAGGFYSAEDADSLLAHGRPEHAEGAFYAWTQAEIEAACGPELAPLVVAHFDVRAEGNVAPHADPHGEFAGKNILRQRRPLAATAQALGLAPRDAEVQLYRALKQLRTVRNERPRPHRDDKILTAWNGLMIAAFARKHAAIDLQVSWFGDDERGHREVAERAAEFIRAELWDEATGTLYRSWREGRSAIAGFAADYASLTHGLLELHAATLDVRWLQWAERLQERMNELFWDEEGGGYFDAAASAAGEGGELVLRLKEDYDGAEPAPSSLAAHNLLRLAALLHRGDWRERALRCLAAFRGQWARSPHALPVMVGALDRALTPPRHVVIAGMPDAVDTRSLLAVVHEQLRPHVHVLGVDGGAGQAWLAERAPWLAGMTPGEDGRARAYVCDAFACQAPVDTPERLRDACGVS